MRVAAVVAFSMAVMAGAACGGDSSEEPAATTAAPGASTTIGATGSTTAQPASSSPGTAAGTGAGTGSITVDAGTFELSLSDCLLGAGGTSAFTIVGATPDGKFEFSAGGVAGATTIGFEEVGTGTVWVVAGGAPTIDGSTFTYDGPALKTSGGATDPATSLRVEVRC